MNVEIVDNEFDVSKVLKGTRLQDITERQREAIKVARARQGSTAWQHGFEDAMTNPTQVYVPGSPEHDQAIKRTISQIDEMRDRRKRQGAPAIGDGIRFEKARGYIVEKEDVNVLINSGVEPEAALKICSSAPRPADPNKVRKAELAAKGPVQRDAEIRFGKL
jgi:hypothetical protein